MEISGIGNSVLNGAVYKALGNIQNASDKLLSATYEINDGDIVDAAMLVSQSKFEAKAGAAIIRASDEITGMILDLVA